MFGMANGLLTIARGTVPLALFGASGYGRLVGRIGGPFLVVQALAPVIVTYVADRASDAAGLALVAAFAVAALICFLTIRRRNSSCQPANIASISLCERWPLSLSSRGPCKSGPASAAGAASFCVSVFITLVTRWPIRS